MAVDIIENAKTSRPSVCNAEEVCLVHKDVAADTGGKAVCGGNKCAVGRDALILPRRNLADCNKRCKPFVGDDACIVPRIGPCLIVCIPTFLYRI